MEEICVCCLSKIEIGDWISLLGVIFTTLFACLLWRTTKKIGERQNELQENQNKQVYRDIYICLKSIHEACTTFFYYLESGILSIVDEKERANFQTGIDKIINARKEYEKREIDIELQLSSFPLLTTSIRILLWVAESVYSHIKSIQMPLNLNSESVDNNMFNTIITLYYLYQLLFINFCLSTKV